MKIDVSSVLEQLNSENRELMDGMESVYELNPCINSFLSQTQLMGYAYSSFKNHVLEVTKPLIKAISCMLESKVDGNSKYLAALNQYLSGMGKVDLDELNADKERLSAKVASLQENSFAGFITKLYTPIVESSIRELDEKIQKVGSFIAASQGCYDNFGTAYSLVMQGIVTSKALAYSSETSLHVSFSTMDMQWAAKASKMYDERNRELVGKKYGDILKDTPYMLSELKEIVEFERFHTEDTQKYSNLLEPLESKDQVQIKLLTYRADKLYRDMLFRYSDKFSIELQEEGTSYFTSSENKIYLSEASFRRDNYQTFFHECGHGIDNYYSKENKLWNDISESFKGSDGMTLDEATEKDVETWSRNQTIKVLDRDYSGLTVEQKNQIADKITDYIMSGGGTGNLTGDEEGILAQVQEEFAFNTRGRTGSLVSDTASGVTNYVLLGDYSHMPSGDRWGTYWKYGIGFQRRNPSCEYFAEYYGYKMTKNIKAQNNVANMYPQSNKVIDEMIVKMNE